MGYRGNDKNLVLSFLRNLGLEFSIFVSNFHYGRVCISNWKMSSLDAFAESLIQEQEKLIQMGVLQTSKNQELLAGDSSNAQARGKQKGNETKNTDSKPKENKNYSDGASSSKKKKKFEKTQCSYYMRGFHKESHCMNKTIN